MFGSKAKQEIQDLESQLSALRDKLSKTEKERDNLSRDLQDAQATIAGLKAELTDTDFEELKEKSRATIAEYEGLKDLYARKIQEFDNSKEEAEQAFARDAARQRFDLENEIHDHRMESQEYVASTVKSFGESYNYYLNQIRVLMDALSDVAAQTGSILFSQPDAHLKESFGTRLVTRLKVGADALQGDEGDRIVIGTAEEEEEPEKPEVEELSLFEEDGSLNTGLLEDDGLAEAVEDVDAAMEEMAVADDLADAIEEIAEVTEEEAIDQAVEEVVEEAAEEAQVETVTDALEEAAEEAIEG